MIEPNISVYVIHDDASEEADAIAGGMRIDVFARVNGNLYQIDAITPDRLSLNFANMLEDYGCIDTSTAVLVREASNEEVKAAVKHLATKTRYFSNRVPLSESESNGLVLRQM